jgi:predicted phosphodiesterase
LWEQETGKTIDTSKSKVQWAVELGLSEAAIRRHLKHPDTARATAATSFAAPPTVESGGSFTHDQATGVSNFNEWGDKAWGKEDFEKFVVSKGEDLDKVTLLYGVTSAPGGGFWNKLMVRPKAALREDAEPAWPVVQPAAPVDIHVPAGIDLSPRRDGMKLSLKSADPQIGFRMLPDGTYEEFHDWKAMLLFVEVCRQEQPDTIIILGDVIDMPSQGKYVQEPGFANTTQKAIDETHVWLSMLRAVCPKAIIVVIEGNHDKRLQNFIQLNAMAAFGLRKANMPAAWPQLSIPNLLRLDELNIRYEDAYPAAVYWDDEDTQNRHGTRANSKGSTTSQYIHELPHLNLWVGHTHRTEITYRTVIGRHGEPLERYSANPGCLCKTDGTVPSVHGALHHDGTSARVVEDWQQGFGSLLYGKGESWPQVHRIKDGSAIYNGRLISV